MYQGTGTSSNSFSFKQMVKYILIKTIEMIKGEFTKLKIQNTTGVFFIYHLDQIN